MRRVIALAACLSCTHKTATPPPPAKPAIASFTANPDTLPGAGTSTLSWQVTGADSLSIDQGVGKVTGASVPVTVAATTTWTLTATNSAGSSTATATVTVNPQQQPALPVIGSFTASSYALPQGGGNITLSWSVTGAVSLALNQAAVTGSSKTVNVSATTTYTLKATNAAGSASADVTILVGSAAGSDPPTSARYAAMIAPVDGESFVGPTVDLRLIGAGRDENNFDTAGPGSGHGQAASVQFFVDGVNVLSVDAANSEYWVFKGYVKGVALAPGDHTVFVRSIYSSNPGPAGQKDSRPVTITVEAAPTYAQTIDLTGDTALAHVVGTSNGRIRVNGNGHRIVVAGAAIDWEYVDFFDLGDRVDTSANGVDVTTSAPVNVGNCRFDSSNPVQFSIAGSAAADVSGNLFRSNMRQPLGQLPYGDSFPAVRFTGSSTGAKTFAHNNLAAGWIDFQQVNHWTVEDNVSIGPRVGIHFDYNGNEGSSSSLVVRRNFSDHVYFGGWSQGNNFEAGNDASLLAEHNVLIGSSWTVRGMAGEFRYNLVLYAGEDWMWLETGALVHHNLFLGGDNNRSGLYNTYGNTGIVIANNTIDGMGGTPFSGVNAIGVTGSETVSSNLFVNLPYTPVELVSGTLAADYNLFFGSFTPSYSDLRAPAHDVHADPKLANPAAHAYEFDEKAVWLRTVSTHDLLAAYRARYAPLAGSPAIDHGDTVLFGAGNDIGAIGAGIDNAADLFGK